MRLPIILSALPLATTTLAAYTISLPSTAILVTTRDALGAEAAKHSKSILVPKHGRYVIEDSESNILVATSDALTEEIAATQKYVAGGGDFAERSIRREGDLFERQQRCFGFRCTSVSECTSRVGGCTICTAFNANQPFARGQCQ